MKHKKPPPPPPMRSPSQSAYDQNVQYETLNNIGPQFVQHSGDTTQNTKPLSPMYQTGNVNYPPHASSIGHITSNSFNLGGCAPPQSKRSLYKPPPPPKRSETTQLTSK